ncbi:MAG: outer membrane lipoprotein LolB [Woeseiaceae bacterium]|nr:outer membrane lipoprotein LolB [Woeseiaceae bacterium]
MTMFRRAFSPTAPEARWHCAAWRLLAVSLLAGCATAPPSIDLPDIDTWDARSAVLGGLRDWQFKGRIAVKAGTDGFNGRFNWSQQGDAFSATVGGPLGIGTMRIEGSGRAVVLTDKDGVRTALPDVETELQHRYGWTIPVASLRFWALGLPDPSMHSATEVDDEGRLRRLEQSNWVVEIPRYSDGGGQPMPRILSATNPETRVRMVIDQWLFFDR